MERLNPLNDYLFFKCFGEKGDEEQLLAFLNAVLGRCGPDAIASVEILENKRFTPRIIGGKSNVLDVRALLEDGTRVNIEVQLQNRGNMDRRSLFYWSREYNRGIREGQDYAELPNVIAINVVNFRFFPQGGFHTIFHLWEDTNRDILLTSALEIHFLDMVKWRAIRGKNLENPLHRWLVWLNRDSPKALLEEAVKMDIGLQKVEELMNYVSQDPDALYAYEMKLKAKWDHTSSINYARREGLKEGKLQGIKEGKLETARNLKALGLADSQISSATGLSPQEIAALE